MSKFDEKSTAGMNFVEVTFPVPWGLIAAKAWGDPCLSPVLMVHGIQDNAGTFDRIMPYLPNQFYYVCIDLPGHGKSSRFPKGMFLDFMLYLSAIRRVVYHLQWSRYVYIGHSFGGQLGSYYSALYPEEVSKLVMLDTLSPKTISVENYLKRRKESIKQLVELENKLLNSDPPNYTYEEALSRIIRGRKGPITDEAAKVLAIRSLKKNSKNFFYFSTDQRLKFGVNSSTTTDHHLIIIESIKCPLLLIITDFYFTYVKNFRQGSCEHRTLEILEKKTNCEIVQVPGHHDVHNDSPDVVSPHIYKFLQHIKSSL